eukprot:gnl/TRDRNA2_/TRDRNA2_39784_c0_seq1.p1 gnl/TRDRNA2_/TRDRNA2_39784_c0~~gnl/TRDRNA2_/TRDRNA2_39784_c0_seq1.p1  ORF type:complete len:332 (+),score=67.73 gnl/TRDRNA2_/TRDRNA2_39784_c0_seq1:37-996(+)
MPATEASDNTAGDEPSEKQLLALVATKKTEANQLLKARDHEGALNMYDEALGLLAQARMVGLGISAEAWSKMLTAAKAASKPGESWYFKVLFGALAQSGVQGAPGGKKDEEAAKLYSNKSMCDGRLGLWAQARDDARGALALWPGWTKARYRLTEALSNLKEHDAALVEANKARAGAGPAESQEISGLLARMLCKAMNAAGQSLETLQGIDVESVSQVLQEQYKALAMLERDAFHEIPGWSAGMEIKDFPLLYTGYSGPERISAWDSDQASPIRFDDFVQLSGKQPRFQEDSAWQSWAKETSEKIRAGLETLLAKAQGQ